MSAPSPAVILTADETMMSRYRGGIFTGFAMCAPSGMLPDWIFYHAFGPPVPRHDGRAVYADCGIRSIEASLLRHGFSEDEVAVVHPRDLDRMAGKETRIISISGHDFLGINPPTSTFTDFIRSGPPYNRIKFLELMSHPVMKKVTTVAGGQSAWQLASPVIMERLGIDHVHLGEGERTVPRVFAGILAGEAVPPVITGEEVPPGEIPPIVHPTIHGLVECSRGCGRGCAFCTPTLQSLRHKPADQVIHDVTVNARGGNHSILLHADDMLCYGGHPLHPVPEHLLSLVQRTGAVEGVRNIGFSHIALATAYHNPGMIEELSGYLATLPDEPYIGVQTGIETGSTRLIGMHMRGKPSPAPPDAWPEVVVQSLSLLHDMDWVIAGTLVAGLPGETEDDVMQSLELVDRLSGLRVLIVPLNFVSMDPARLSDHDSFNSDRMTPAHWQLFGACIEHDIRIGRELCGLMVGGSLVTRAVGTLALRYLMHAGERYVSALKQGLPPDDFDPGEQSYRLPNL